MSVEAEWASLIDGLSRQNPVGARQFCEAVAHIAQHAVATVWHVDPGSSVADCVGAWAGVKSSSRIRAATAWPGNAAARHGQGAPWTVANTGTVIRAVSPDDPLAWSEFVQPTAPAAIVRRLRAQPDGACYLALVCDTPDEAVALEPLAKLLESAATGQPQKDAVDFRNVIEGSPSITFAIRDEQIVYANPAMLGALGYSRREVVDSEFDPLLLIHPRDRDRIRGHIASILGGAPSPGPIEVSLLARDGAAIDALLSSVLQRNGVGTTLYFTALNITDRVRLETELFAYTGQVGALQEVLVDILEADLSHAQIVDRICRSMCHIVNADIVAGYLFTPDGSLDLQAFYGPLADDPKWVQSVQSQHMDQKSIPSELLEGDGPLAQCLATREPVVTEHLEENARIPRSPLGEAAGLDAFMWIPLRQGDHQLMGALYIGTKAGELGISDSHLQSLTLFATQTALAIQKATLVAEERERRRESASLLRASVFLRDDLALQGLHERICEAAATVVSARYIALLLPSETGFGVGHVRGAPTVYIKQTLEPAQESLAQRSFSEGETQSAEAIRPTSDFPFAVSEGDDDTFHVLSVPLISYRQTVGVLMLVNPSDEAPFSARDRQAIETYAQQAAGTLDNATLLAQVTETKNYFEYLLDSASDIIWTVDFQGALQSINAVGRRLGAWLDRDMVGMHMRDILHPDDLTSSEERIRAIAEGQPVEQPYQLRVQTGPNHYTTLEVTSRPIEQDGRVVGVFAIGRDISQREKVEQQVRRSEKLAALGGLLAGVAHELNNPLTGVIGYAEMLSETPDPDIAELGERIYREAQRCRSIVESLIALHPDTTYVSELVSSENLIEQTIALVRYRYGLDNVSIETDIAAGINSVRASADQLQRALLQILQNAYEAIVSTERDGTIRISATMQADNIRIEIEDDGVGIASDACDHALDPFYTTKDDAPGRGLGLSMVNNVIVAAGGDIALAPRPQGGTRVTLELPSSGIAAQESEPQQLTPQSPVEAPLVEIASPPEHSQAASSRILVVDDEIIIGDLLRDLLSMLEYEVDVAHDGEEALVQLEANSYALIISDIKMPVMNGIEFFHAIETDHPHMVERVLFSSGDTITPETRSFLEGSGRPCVSKPYNLQDLKAAVHNTLLAAQSATSSP